jgi:hypothetical protein
MKINEECCQTIPGADLCILPKKIVSIFKIKIKYIATPLIADNFCTKMFGYSSLMRSF